jgi:hypothetical protein
MAVKTNGSSKPRAGEETPLLRDQVGNNRNDVSITSPTSHSTHEEEGIQDSDKANQDVGKLRGLFIALSLWGLIFLQG